MEFGVTAIGLASVALCAMPFVLTNRNRKIKEKKIDVIFKRHRNYTSL